MSEIMRRVSYCISTASIERPGHLVCFRGNVNDTDVPGLAVGKETPEISFDWRAMFSRFCAEEKLKNHFYKNLVGLLKDLFKHQNLLLTRSSYLMKGMGE